MKKLQALGKMIELQIPKGHGFMLMVYPHNAQGECHYVSNSKREDVVAAMTQFLETAGTEENFGKEVSND